MVDDPTKPTILQEVPDNCDTCGASMSHLTPIKQTSTTTFQIKNLVVGYICQACETQHLYRK